MNIYKYGSNLEHNIYGGQKLNNEPSNFVCVFEEELSEPTESTFQKMLKLLTEQGLIITDIFENNLKVVTDTGDTYTLANNTVFSEKNGDIELIHCSLLAFIFDRPFRKDALYLDADGLVVDLTGRAIKDIHNGKIHLQSKNLNWYLTQNPMLVIDLFYFSIVKGWAIDGIVWKVYKECYYGRSPILKEVPDKLIQCFKENSSYTIELMIQNPGFKDWLLNACNFEIALSKSQPQYGRVIYDAPLFDAGPKLEEQINFLKAKPLQQADVEIIRFEPIQVQEEPIPVEENKLEELRWNEILNNI